MLGTSMHIWYGWCPQLHPQGIHELSLYVMLVSHLRLPVLHESVSLLDLHSLVQHCGLVPSYVFQSRTIGCNPHLRVLTE